MTGRIVTSNASSGGGKVRNPWEDRGTTKAAPGGASTPNSQGLADYLGVDCE